MNSSIEPANRKGFDVKNYHPAFWALLTVGIVVIFDLVLDLVVWRYLKGINTYSAMVLNTVFLIMVVIPFVYFLLYRPLSRIIVSYKNAMDEVKLLRGIIPICSYCKKIRDEEGSWNQIEDYIHSQSGAKFSHGICPECYNKEMEKME